MVAIQTMVPMDGKMSIRERVVGGDARFGWMRIRSGDYDLIVESRELYTSYRIVRTFSSRHSYYAYDSILYHDVRTPEPVPVRPAHIIQARNIPWFMWIYYGIRSWLDKRQWDQKMRAAAERERIRINALRDLADKHMGGGRFGGRYNR
jgi:hypothetical protein